MQFVVPFIDCVATLKSFSFNSMIGFSQSCSSFIAITLVFAVTATFSDVDLVTFPTTSGFRSFGATNSYTHCFSAGDFNGDGLNDLVYYSNASPFGRTDATQSYVLLGKKSATPYSVIDLTTATADRNGFYIYGAAAGDAHWINFGGTAGDVNNDG